MTYLGRWTAAIAVYALVSGLLLAQSQVSYCAFEVTVRSPEGDPVSGAPVAALAQDGKTIGLASTDKQGVARVCDAPAELTDIRVGGRLCGAVTLHYMTPYWLETRHVVVTYKNCNGEEFAPMGGCSLTIRLRDQEGHPLEGVLFDDPNERAKKRAQTRLSDWFGRIFRFTDYGDTLSGRFLKDGYVPQNFTEQCGSGDPKRAERTVVLNPSGPARN
jgi:hypothetical protein